MLVEKKCPIDTSVEYIPGEYNIHTFFGSSYVNVLSDLVCYNPDSRVFKWAIDHGFNFPEGGIRVNNYILNDREDILEYIFEHRPNDVFIGSRTGDMKVMIKSKPELMRKVLLSCSKCDNYTRTGIYKHGDVEFVEFMRNNNMMEDTDKIYKESWHNHESNVLEDSLRKGNIEVAKWAHDNGFKPRRKELFFDIIYKSTCLLYTSPSPRDRQKSRMPSSA